MGIFGRKNTDETASAAPTATTADAGPPIDLNALKRELVDDLMRQLRNEFERGG
ncbi:hypothetical protein KMT30_11020 [Streptomyces sp. IBSBF 2953]|nr:hypothetical protein [Streptomyces hayashii]